MVTDFEKALNMLTENIVEYRNLADQDGYTLNRLLQNITGILFYLEKHRSEIHHKFQTEIHSLVLDKMTVSRAENQAHTKYPEMYMLRRVLDSAYEVVGAIRSNISSLNKQRIE